MFEDFITQNYVREKHFVNCKIKVDLLTLTNKEEFINVDTFIPG